MKVQVAPLESEVGVARETLDKFSSLPPDVAKNPTIPGRTILTYEVKDKVDFSMAALGVGLSVNLVP